MLGFGIAKLKTTGARNVFTLLVGHTISKIILAIGAIVLAKYYSAENYGYFNVFISYVLIISVIASLRLENGIVLTKDASTIKKLVNVILLSGFILTPFFLGVFSLIKYFFTGQIFWNWYTFFLCAVTSFFTLANNTYFEFFTKYKLFKLIAVGTIGGSLFTIILQLIFLLLGVYKFGLVYGVVIAALLMLIFYYVTAKATFTIPSIAAIKAIAIAQRRIIQFTFASDIINTIANNGLPIIVAMFFIQHEVGIFAMAMKLITTPLIIISLSISRVYFRKATLLFPAQKKQLLALTWKIILYNLILTSAFLIILLTVGAYFLNNFFGAEWKGLNQYIGAMSFWILARSTVNPISSVILILKKNYYSLLFNIFLLCCMLLSFYTGYLQHSLLAGTYFFSIFTAIGYVVLLVFILNAIRNYKYEP